MNGSFWHHYKLRRDKEETNAPGEPSQVKHWGEDIIVEGEGLRG